MNRCEKEGSGKEENNNKMQGRWLKSNKHDQQLFLQSYNRGFTLHLKHKKTQQIAQIYNHIPRKQEFLQEESHRDIFKTDWLQN